MFTPSTNTTSQTLPSFTAITNISCGLVESLTSRLDAAAAGVNIHTLEDGVDRFVVLRRDCRGIFVQTAMKPEERGLRTVTALSGKKKTLGECLRRA